MPFTPRPSVGGTKEATIVVAASNAMDASKAMADFVCNGFNDQIVINSALSTMTTGGILLLTEGFFNISGQINLKGQVSISGSGINSTLIQIESSISTPINAFFGNNTSNLTISNFELMANTLRTNRHGIRIENANTINIENVRFNTIRVNGVRLVNCHTSRISNCIFHDGGGIFASGANFNINNNSLLANWGMPIDVTINPINLGSPAIILDNIGNVTNNVIISSIQGMSFQNGINGMICNNLIQSVRDDGIRFNNVRNSMILGNIVRLNLSSALHNVDDGLEFINTCLNNTVQFNQVRRSPTSPQFRAGISLGVSCDNNFVSNNDLFESGATSSLINNGSGNILVGGNRL